MKTIFNLFPKLQPIQVAGNYMFLLFFLYIKHKKNVNALFSMKM